MDQLIDTKIFLQRKAAGKAIAEEMRQHRLQPKKKLLQIQIHALEKRIQHSHLKLARQHFSLANC